jgi:hypothetical protein
VVTSEATALVESALLMDVRQALLLYETRHIDPARLLADQAAKEGQGAIIRTGGDRAIHMLAAYVFNWCAPETTPTPINRQPL